MCDSKEDERAKALAAERRAAAASEPDRSTDKRVRRAPADKMIRGRDLLNK